MWIPTSRRQHSRVGLRYETNLTDAEWAVIEPLMPRPAPCGRPPLRTIREVLNAIFYVLRGGISWRLIPKDLPPRSTTFGYFSRWRDTGLFGRINHHLVMLDCERIGREASPSAAVLDSQGIKTTESGGRRGYDAGKRVNVRQRQALVYLDGRTLVLDPQHAGVQDRDGAVPVLRLSRRTFLFIAKAFTDAGYGGNRPATATIITVEIVRKPPDQVGFAVHPRRWVRVSTGRQAKGDISIPDQRKQVHAFCMAEGWLVVGEYVEPGASATDDNRPEFQRMIERAGDDDHPFDVIVVHSYSRFFRDSFGLEMYVRRLARAGMRPISITQELGDDSAQVMMRQVIAMFDEYQSKENAKHVLRAMKENGRQGFYNGSPVPLGYTVAEVEKRGAWVKKRLAVDPVEAETVRLIFLLYRFGDGATGPLGVKAITCHLNERCFRTRAGARFGVATMYKILTNRAYVGEFVFNRRCSRALAEKPAAEHIPISVPALIKLPEFEAVQAMLKAHDPRSTPARVVTGPILLTGLATCTTCNGPMTLRTGTSRSGKVHRYYSCSTHGRIGRTGCTGRSIPMDTLDTLVTDHLVAELLQPDRLWTTLSSLWALRAEKAAQVDGRVAALRGEVSEAEEKLKRLYRMVEEGVTDLDDILKGRLAALKEERDRARTALDRIHVAERAPAEIAPELVEKFGRLMRANVTSGEVPLRKAWLQAIVDRVEVDADVIRIVGDKASLEAAVIGAASTAAPGVRSSVRKWRARKDSNL